MSKTQAKLRIEAIKQLLPIALILIIILHLLFQYLRITYPDIDFIVDLSNRFNVDDEVSLPTWYSVCLLLGLSAGSYWLSLQKKAQKLWRPASIVFLLMSIDEGSGFHELLITPLRNALDVDGASLIYNAWIIVGLIIVTYIGFKLLRLLKEVPSIRLKKQFIIGFTLYISGILLIESIGGLYENSGTIYQVWIVLIEESLELAGLSVLALGVLESIED